MSETTKPVAHCAQDHPPPLAIIDLNMGCVPQPMSSYSQVIQVGLEAWSRLKKNKTLADWWIVGDAFLAIRSEAMLSANTNRPEGAKYSRECSYLLKKASKLADGTGLDEIDKSTRSRLLECLAHRSEVEVWLATLPVNLRIKLNHPEVVLRRWRRTQIKKSDGTVKKPSYVAKLEQSVANLEEQNARLARDAPITPRDKPRDQAATVWRLLLCSPSAARALCRELSKLARTAETEDQAVEVCA